MYEKNLPPITGYFTLFLYSLINFVLHKIYFQAGILILITIGNFIWEMLPILQKISTILSPIFFLKQAKAMAVPLIYKFNDSSWRTLNVPHDWVVELPFVNSPNFDVMAHGYKPVGGLFPETSIGWYRKHFFIDRKDSGSVFKFSLMEFSAMQMFGSMEFILEIIKADT